MNTESTTTESTYNTTYAILSVDPRAEVPSSIPLSLFPLVLHLDLSLDNRLNLRQSILLLLESWHELI